MSKGQSSIEGMTIGQERRCLNQIYRASENQGSLDPNWLLHNGETAGGFCLKYIVGHHAKRKRKQINKRETGKNENEPEPEPEPEPESEPEPEPEPPEPPEPAEPEPEPVPQLEITPRKKKSRKVSKDKKLTAD